MRVSLELINLVGAQDISGTLDNDPIIRQLEQQNFQKLKADFQSTIASICKDNNKQQKITIKPFMDYSKEQ
jgi:di/tripeptidase